MWQILLMSSVNYHAKIKENIKVNVKNNYAGI